MTAQTPAPLDEHASTPPANPPSDVGVAAAEGVSNEPARDDVAGKDSNTAEAEPGAEGDESSSGEGSDASEGEAADGEAADGEAGDAAKAGDGAKKKRRRKRSKKKPAAEGGETPDCPADDRRGPRCNGGRA